VDICNNVIVASIANKFVVASEMPKVEYRTMVEEFVDVTFGLTIIILFTAFFVEHVYEKYGEDSASVANASIAVLLLFFVACLIGRNVYQSWKIRKECDLWMKNSTDFQAGVNVDEHTILSLSSID
jgi:hypothetical protein